MRESLKNHVLELLSQTETVSAWYLKRPGKTRMMATLITFTPEGIVLQGDLTPGQNGNVSVGGYGIGWFSGDKSEDYLCEKFLTKEFVPELAIEYFKDQIFRWRREDPNGNFSKEQAREAWDDIVTLERNQEVYSHTFYELYSETFNDTPECGYGYNLGEAGWLCAIQQKFAELYKALGFCDGCGKCLDCLRKERSEDNRNGVGGVLEVPSR
jgi:hypothetical protein